MFSLTLQTFKGSGAFRAGHWVAIRKRNAIQKICKVNANKVCGAQNLRNTWFSLTSQTFQGSETLRAGRWVSARKVAELQEVSKVKKNNGFGLQTV